MGTIYTIGFTKRSAESFFKALTQAGVDLVIDVRLNNSGQLAGFTKKGDLQYFLGLFGIGYQHWEHFAPTKDMRDRYHNGWNWDRYEAEYRELLRERGALVGPEVLGLTNRTPCLLCSELMPDRCHRRIAAEAIANVVQEMGVAHL